MLSLKKEEYVKYVKKHFTSKTKKLLLEQIEKFYYLDENFKKDLYFINPFLL